MRKNQVPFTFQEKKMATAWIEVEKIIPTYDYSPTNQCNKYHNELDEFLVKEYIIQHKELFPPIMS